jgi:hypothetical protein
MKGKNIRSWVITLALAAGLVPFSQAFGAQNQSPSQQQRPPNAQQQPPEQQPPNAQPQAPSAQKQPQTFVGKIVQTKNGQYALLTDPKGGKGYFLDDQKDAKKFDQKNVKVVATLDPQTSTLHVIEIKLAS